MKGLELAEQYYETYGKPMLESRFPEVMEQAATGLVGQGSECFGFDDAISTDHDFGPSFCIWLPWEIYSRYGEAMTQAYRELPEKFLGFSGRKEQAQGAGRVGVLCLEEFYRGLLGRDTPPVTVAEWLSIPEEALATATNGKVFADPLGRFSKMRSALLSYYPDEVWLRHIANCLAKAAQAGQYNYTRALQRGERITAELSLGIFLQEIMHLVYLFNRQYAPYYKWMHRGIKDLPCCSEIADMMDLFYQVPNPEERVLIIEAICNIMVQELNSRGISSGEDNFLQSHVGEVLRHIEET